MSEFQSYYSGRSTNRLAWMRQSGTFLKSALICPQAKFFLFHELRPLTTHVSPSQTEGLHPSHKLLPLSWPDIANILKTGGISTAILDDVIDQSGTIWPKLVASCVKKTPGITSAQTCPILAFLGTEGSTEQPTVNQSFQSTHGSPIWVIDVSTISERLPETLIKHGQYIDLKKVVLAPTEANLAAQARALIDWNSRNKFCAACGRPTYSTWSGWKLACTSSINQGNFPHDQEDHGALATKANCLTNKFSVQNFCYPRTDPVCIMGIANSTGDSILLGRKRVWPRGFYSCLAGFVEPGESIEDCCRREVLEEAGIEVESVYYHSSQPWPFPGSLMIGVIGKATRDAKMRLDLDNELEDARFFPRSLILDVLDSSKTVEFTEEELKRFDDNFKSSASDNEHIAPQSANPDRNKIHLTIPPPTAIAHQLIRSWATDDKWSDFHNSLYERSPNF